MARPVKVLKSGRIECAIFKNEQFNSFNFKFQKSYKGKDGQWNNTDYFSDTDMGDLGALVDHIRESRVKEKNDRPEPVVKPASQPINNFDDDIPF